MLFLLRTQVGRGLFLCDREIHLQRKLSWSKVTSLSRSQTSACGEKRGEKKHSGIQIEEPECAWATCSQWLIYRSVWMPEIKLRSFVPIRTHLSSKNPRLATHMSLSETTKLSDGVPSRKTTGSPSHARVGSRRLVPDQIYSDVLEAYRIGSQQPPPYLPEPDDTSAFTEGMPLNDEIRLSESAKYRASALRRAQAGELELASKLLCASKAYLKAEHLTRKGYCIGLQFYCGVEAYVYYQNGEFEAARRSIRQSLHAVNELQEKFGYGHVDGRRVHLARNLLRLDAHGGEPLDAADAAFHLLLYVMGIDAAWPYADLRSTAPDRVMTNEVRHMLFDQVARELVLLFIHADEEARTPFVERGEDVLSRFHLPMSLVNNEVYSSGQIQTTRLWLELKKLLLAGDTSAFVNGVHDFFQLGPRVPALWYGVMRDVVQVCKKAESFHAYRLKKQLLDDAGSMEALDKVAFSALFESS